MFFFYILKVCFIAKADNSTFHVLEFKKNTRFIFVICSDDNVDAWQTLFLLWS